jgi:TonB-linked SusC/RagA family outer membrane protein
MAVTRVLVGLRVVAFLLEVEAVPLGAQDRVISGTVVSAASALPIQGATVQVAGSTQAAHTDALGRFRLVGITSTQPVTLEVHRLGYRSLRKTALVGDGNVRFALEETAVTLDAIVVTGTAGETKARAVGNEVVSIAARDVMQLAPVGDVQQLINARAPGVVIMPYQGNVGTGGAIRVRGNPSIQLSNEPLLFLDGMRVNNSEHSGPNIRNGRQVSRINDINPEEIESIEIVKGPAAATLYGTEASRGVIQILTRRGTPGPPRWSVAIKQGANWFMNPAGRLPWEFGHDTLRAGSPLDSINLYLQEYCYALAGPLNFDAEGRCIRRPMFRTGHVQSYDASVSGGTDVMRYYISANAGREEGIVWYNWRDKFDGRANLSLMPSDKVEITTNLNFIENSGRLGQSKILYGLMDQLLWGSPTTRNTPRRGFLRATPEAAASIESRSGIQRFLGSVQVKYQLWNWLTQRITLGADIGNEASSTLYPRLRDDEVCFFAELCLGEKTTERRQTSYASFDYGAVAAEQLSSSLSGQTSVGAQYYRKSSSFVQAVGSKLPSPEITSIGAAASSSSTEDVIQNKSVGVFGQQQFGWKQRLFLTGAVRADDNSAFGANFNFVTYPKVSASWVLSDEPFWPLKFANSLKLRAAWGQAGQQPDAFAAVRSYQAIPGPGDVPSFTPRSVGNPDLKPERGEEVEAGLDARLWDDRIGLTFTYFRQRLRDAIVPRVLSPSSGFAGIQLVNLGAVRNRGIELSIDADVVKTRPVALNFGLGFSTNDNRVLSLGGLPPIRMAQTLVSDGNLPTGQWYREGYPVGSYFFKVIVSAQRDPVTGKVSNILCDGGPGADPVPCTTTTPLVYAGRSTPPREGSLRTTITIFENLRLYALADIRWGHTVLNEDIRFSHLGTARNSRAINDSSDVILLAIEQSAGIGDPVSAGLMKAGFAKLREVSASYALPDGWARRLRASRASITVAGRNLAILWREQRKVHGLTAIDPEIRGPDEQSSIVQNALPQNAQVVTTLRLTF